MIVQSESPDGDISHLTYYGPLFTFVVLSRPRIRYATIAEPYVVVSISDPGDEDAEIAVSPQCRAILRLQFDDVDPALQSLRGRAPLMMQDARIILDFVHQNTADSGVKTIVCQCSMGISRSAGTAAALSRILQGEDAFFFAAFSPNQHVYTTLLEVEQRNA